MKETPKQSVKCRLKQGDEGAYRTLVHHYQDRLFKVAYGILLDREEAWDIVQDVFFSIWKNRDTLNITESVKSYLYRAVHNQGVNYIKRKKLERDYLHTLNPEPVSENEESQIELKRKIHDVVASLPPKRREIFRMNRYEGLKYRQIAERLGISIKTVENQMGSALKYLEQHLKEFLTLIWFWFN